MSKQDIEEINRSSDSNKMRKYKEKSEQRLKLEDINPKDLQNSK